MTYRIAAPPAMRDPVRYARRRRWLYRSLAWGFPVALVALWQLAASREWIDTRLFPSPSDIVTAGRELVDEGTLQEQVWISLQRVWWGLFWGSVTGVAVGFACGAVRVVRATLESTLSALYTVPKLALLPMLLLIFGSGESPKVILIAITVFFFMWLSAMAAVMEVSDGYREAARAFRVSHWQMFRHVLFPATLPQILVGLRLSSGVAVLMMVGAEFAQGNDGIGKFIFQSWTLFLADRMYIGIVAVALMGLAFSMAITALTRVLVRWAPRDRDQVRAR
ncbi:MAG TPA: ABC transporter permease [Acidimicrobiales bacterium]|nr:ABC transporter permease [Acidimicrobiales bacterium]